MHRLTNVLARLGPVKYSNFDFDQFSLILALLIIVKALVRLLLRVGLELIFRFGKVLVLPSLF